jgi:hypothetical protein
MQADEVMDNTHLTFRLKLISASGNSLEENSCKPRPPVAMTRRLNAQQSSEPSNLWEFVVYLTLSSFSRCSRLRCNITSRACPSGHLNGLGRSAHELQRVQIPLEAWKRVCLFIGRVGNLAECESSSSRPSVRLSARRSESREQLKKRWTHFHDFWYSRSLQKMVEILKYRSIGTSGTTASYGDQRGFIFAQH